jgi:(methylthio)acryloyl-CoA hydratase
MQNNPDITFEIRNDIAVITLTRASKRNALNDALIATLKVSMTPDFR